MGTGKLYNFIFTTSEEAALNTTWQEKLRYKFDNLMARGTGALIAGLGILSLILIVVMAAFVVLTQVSPADGEPISFWEAAWLSLMRTLDAGTMGGDEGWGFRLTMFVVTIGGVFIISTLIGVLTSGIETKMEDLRKGRSRVIESDHTVILGWAPQIHTILSELVVANENRKDACIVILGDKDKVEMEEEIRAAMGSSGKTRIVCRTGSPIDLNDLQLVSLQTARSIIILSSSNENPDAQAIKTILAITNNPNRRATPYHIVAEIKDPKNINVASMVGKDEAELVLTGDLISRIIAQTCRQSGLSVVYTELLDFGGDEIYFKEEPSLAGKTFHETLLAYKDSAVIGLRQKGGTVKLNPPMDTRVQAGDQIIAVSADDDTIVLDPATAPSVQLELISSGKPEPRMPERTLILGWNWRAPAIIHELDAYTAPQSEVMVVADHEGGAEEIDRLCPRHPNLTVTYQQADTTDRQVLETVAPQTYHHIIVLSYSDTREVQEADSCTLITLLHLRDMSEKLKQDFAIVSEMLDVQNRALAEVTHADDFIVSDKLISLIMTQVSENKQLNAIFTDIFDPDGSEIYLKPVSEYVKLNTPVNFYTVIEAAARKGELAMGYRLKAFASQAEKAYGVRVNPDKAEKVTFSAEDKVVVLAES
jgi:voltage-gated potassium channel Kch